LWKELEGDLDNRQRLVRVLYPDGLSYSKEEGYRTPLNSPVAMVCAVVSGQENGGEWAREKAGTPKGNQIKLDSPTLLAETGTLIPSSDLRKSCINNR
jgi:hypothetical protein